MKLTTLILYPEDFHRYSDWEAVCNVCDVSPNVTCIHITFDPTKITVEEE